MQEVVTENLTETLTETLTGVLTVKFESARHGNECKETLRELKETPRDPQEHPQVHLKDPNRPAGGVG